MPRGIDQPVQRRRGRGRRKKGEVTTAVLDRGEKVFRYRADGYSIAEASRRLKLTYSMARDAYHAYINSIAIPEQKVHVFRALQNHRIEDLIAKFYSMALGGSIEALNALDKLFRRQADLLGLDRPKTLDVRVYVPTQDPHQAAERMNKRLQDVGYPQLPSEPPIKQVEGTVVE